MKTYLADTNFYLRFILQDDKELANKAEEELKRASEKKNRIIFLSAVILEMNFVLKSVYSLSAFEISKHLSALVKTDYLGVEDREVWLRVFRRYKNGKNSLMDIFLFEKAKSGGGAILTFDKDLKGLK